MQLLRIEPTPSPNSMKLQLDIKLPDGVRRTYTPQHKDNAPALIKQLLDIEGVKSIFHTADFIALDRKSQADWAEILSHVQAAFGWSSQSANIEEVDHPYNYGEAHVYVQYFRAIPMQIRVQAGGREERIGLSERFSKAVHEVASTTLIKERKLKDYGTRYGELSDIAREVEQELEATYDPERLASLVQQAIAQSQEDIPFEETLETWDEPTLQTMLDHEDWHRRYAALDRMAPSMERLELYRKLLDDPQAQIRRLVIVHLGGMDAPEEAIPLLIQALQDSSVSVRRTAGDTLSDIGDPAAIVPMMAALQDKNKVVRWRAARYLYEVGDEQAVPALTAAMADPEFEVALQARMAVERIESGEEAAGTVWQQMARSRQSE